LIQIILSFALIFIVAAAMTKPPRRPGWNLDTS
jgi:hypothetical protein